MERYKEYKDSGVQWIGDIPNHWESRRLKSLVTCNDECLSESTDSNKEIMYVEIGDVDSISGIKNYTIYSFKNAPSRARRITKRGDVIISTVRTYLKAIAYIDRDDYIVSTGFAVLRSKNILPKYLSYSTMFEGFTDEVLKNSIGISYPAISATNLLRLSIPLPPLSEQQRIVDFLEDKTKKIDQYIAEKEKQLQLLEEYKQSLIANAVTKGLNPDVKMKDSGISWIGMIPEHWEVSRMKRIFSESKEKTENEEGVLLSLSQYTGISLKENAKKVGMFEAESTIGYNVVHKGQFVMNIMLAWNGSYAVSDYEGIISPSYSVFDFNEECNHKYFHYLLRTQAYAGAFRTMSKGIIDSRLRLYPTYFFTFKTIVPPVSEQNSIVSYIKEKCTKVDSLISDLETEISHIKEYKQRLIADCVTGQVKV